MRTVIVLAARYSFGLSSADAASGLGIEPSQVDDRLRTTVQRLRARIAGSAEARGAHRAEPRPAAGPARPADRLASLADDQLGGLTIAVVFADLPWIPDVAPATITRLAREGVAYAEEAPAAAALTTAAASTGSASNGQPGSTISRTESVPRTTTRGQGFPALRTAVLVAGFAIFGFALAASAQRWQLPAEHPGPP